ncbi:MAG: MATE family efflux transporter [Eubacterium sp.]|nr:MATE family efflux transporter [Eubacterium sp.]
MNIMSQNPINQNHSTKGKSKNNLMTEGNILKQIILFSIPLILGNFLQQMYNTVDSIIVGNYIGSNALAAVGSSTSLIALLIGFSQGIAVGAGVVISQLLGAKNKKDAKIAIHTALSLSIILGLILTIVGIFLSPQILRLMKTPSEVMIESISYLRIYFVGVIFNIIYNMSAGILNASGNSKIPLIYLGIASVTNIVLDLILIVILNMGVEGAAIATDISQVVSCVLALLFLIKVNADYKVSLREIRIHKNMAARIIKIGLPTGIQNMVISFSNVLVQSSVNVFGAKAIAGFGAYMKIDGFNILPVLSFSMAITTFAGQNYGAGNFNRIKKGMWLTLIIGFAYTIFTSIFLLTFSNQVIGLFTKDIQVIEYGILAMKYFCPFYFLLSILYGLAGTIRGVGKPIPPMLVLLTSLCLFRIIWIQFILPLFSNITSIFILYPVSWTLGVTLMVIYTLKGRWLPEY